tara:strand:+ start:519 stop:1103 length:585 start_codon:yes stop_codon:yes gene_type:complete
MKLKIFKFENVTSTNDVAINLIKEKRKISGCVCAKTQKKGRGTYGKRWISKKGNFFGSIFFQLKRNYPAFNEFSIINPVIISSVIQQFCKNKKINIKWPNDIFVNKKKICGILQEHIILNKKKFLIIGIGINVISNPKINNKYQTTNICLESKIRPSINKLIKSLITSYESFFYDLNSYEYKIFKKKAESMALN